MNIKEKIVLKMITQKEDEILDRIEEFKLGKPSDQEKTMYINSVQAKIERQLKVVGVEITPAIAERMNYFKEKLLN